MDLDRTDLAPKEESGADKWMVLRIMVVFLFLMIATSAGQLLRSVVQEKENWRY